MKSYGGLFDRILAPDNLEAALDRAARGKRDRPPVQRFLATRGVQLAALRQELETGTYRPRPYQQFGILDPKPRRISCADFRDRVVHHAVCTVLAPLIERRLIADNSPAASARAATGPCCGPRSLPSAMAGA
jgi:RNA-directed DNA polymerase